MKVVEDGLQVVSTAFAEKDASLNAMSLQVDGLSAANVALQAQLDTANATIADLKAKLEPKPPAPKTVKDYGVVGDGIKDDTAAMQAALDAGVRDVPAGKYLIDPAKSLLVRDGVQVKADPNAILLCKANALPRYYIVRLVGAKSAWTGGQIMGDRDRHTYTAGSTHEWGYGAMLSGDGASLTDCVIDGCTGDGIGVSGDNVTLRNVVSKRNRRQGLSVFACKGFRAYNCQFNDTKGTAPQAGVDFEPDNGAVLDAVMENCIAKNNSTAGFMAWVRAEVAGNVEVTLKNCNTEGNANGIQGKGLNGKALMRVEGGNHVNRSAGVRSEDGCTVTLVASTFSFAGKPVSFAQQWAVQKVGTGQVVQTGVVYK
ncbi:Phage protein [Lysobacter dokdonensis DS-58]|uniref:Phage protein n=1 Tax=Lysobacter dokdonensis DS-58 TaxID=1300345 RepID=A0A0A2WNP5_9GAMM|nr:right-handed parallel beta-helix repeat-containing protein [Lysobacter dokdonensis]KGQ19915.1 Phage protein [Lysobacter dokdonensis DS-58]